MCKFSLIIPHKNIPDLLQRALNSVPKRDDIQIIIDDDSSDSNKVDFDNFPGCGEPNTKVYFTKENKGAGFARNVGLEQAKGDWVFFMDADDTFSPKINKILDLCKDDGVSDLVYFDNVVIENWSNKVLKKNERELIKTKEQRYLSLVPWGKLLKRQFIEDYNIRFEETVYANDTMFAIKASTYCKNFRKINIEGYNYYLRENSLWNTISKESILCRLDNAERCYDFARNNELKLLTKYLTELYVLLLAKLKKVDPWSYYKIMFIKSFKFRGFNHIIKNYCIGLRYRFKLH